MTILHFFSLFLLKLIIVGLTPIEEIKDELHEKHLNILDIYTGLMGFLIEEKDCENINDKHYYYENVAYLLKKEVNENETVKILLEKYSENDFDTFITAKKDELRKIENEIKLNDTLSLDLSLSPEFDFFTALKTLEHSKHFDHVLNQYKNHSGSISRTTKKNGLCIVERLRDAVEEQVKRLELIREKTSQVKKDFKKVECSDENVANPTKF